MLPEMLPGGRTWRAAAGVCLGIGAAALGLATVGYVSVTRGIAFGIFTGESTRALVDDWYAGLLSDSGILIWAVGSVAAFVAAYLDSRRRGSDVGFFVGMGLITAWIAADDALLWHEELIPDAVGVPENVVFAVYGLIGLAAIVLGRHAIERNLWWVFGAACVLLGLSVGVELLGLSADSAGAGASSFKFVGIAAWSAFFVEAAIHRARRPRPLRISNGHSTWPPPRAGSAVVDQNRSG